MGETVDVPNASPIGRVFKGKTTAFALQMPLVVLQMAIEIKPYFGNQNLTNQKWLREFNIIADEQTRVASNFNPTISQEGTVIQYDYNKWVARGTITVNHKMEAKYLIMSYDSNFKMSNFFVNEKTDLYSSSNSFIKLKKAFFKWLIIDNCHFNIQNQIIFTIESNNVAVLNSYVNVTQQYLICQVFSYFDCKYNEREGGAANQFIWDNNTVTGYNTQGTTRVIYMYSYNKTITNSRFIDVKWERNRFGIVGGLKAIDCPNIISYTWDIFENNTFLSTFGGRVAQQIPVQIWNEAGDNQYINTIVRNNVFINLTYNEAGIIDILKFNIINYRIVFENNYFENISSGNSDFPMIQIMGEKVYIKNITIKNVNVSMGMYIQAFQGSINSITIIDSSGTNSALLTKAFITISDSGKLLIQNILFRNCYFNSLRALQLQNVKETSLENLVIKDSTASYTHVLFLSDVFDLSLNYTSFVNLKKNESATSDIRIVKINSVQSWDDPKRVNKVTFSNMNYQNSTIPFFDLLGAFPSALQSQDNYQYPNEESVGIKINFSNLNLERIFLTGKQRLFTTQGINQKNLVALIIQDSNVTGNNLEKGAHFEFKHNFERTGFERCIIESNTGYFIEMIPQDSQNLNKTQKLTIHNSRFSSNNGFNYGLFHVTQNCYLEIQSSIFEENNCIGRGAVVYSEQKSSYSILKDSQFLKNYGQMGGVLFSDKNAEIQVENCKFISNFAIYGGVAYVQNDGMMKISKSNFTQNLALQASLFYVFNSQNMLQLDGGYILENGFLYSQLGLSQLKGLTLAQKWALIQNNFRNQNFTKFLQSKSSELILLISDNKENYQIMIVKATVMLNGGLLIENQDSIMTIHSVSNVIFDDVVIKNIQNIQAPLILLDQSYISATKLMFMNTSSIEPLISIQSDSEFVLAQSKISSQAGQIFSLQNSLMTILDSNFSEIIQTSIKDPLFKVQMSTINFQNISISKVSQSSESNMMPILRLRDSEMFINGLQANYFSTQLISLIRSDLKVQKSNFTHAENILLKGIVIYSEESNVNVTESIFSNLTSQQGGAIYSIQQQNSQLQRSLNISKCQFSKMKSIQGGTLFVQDTIVTIFENTFSQSLVTQSGGALYLACSTLNSKKCQFDINQNEFINNQANISGGSIYYNTNQPRGLLNNNYSMNQAKYGNNFASYPSQIKLLNSNTSWTDFFVSGQDIPTEIMIGIFDQNDQLIIVDSESSCTISSDDLNLQISGITKVKAEQGIYKFSQVNLVALPNYSSHLKFVSSLGSEVQFTMDTVIPIKFRECLLGEVTQNRKCIKCIKNTYSFDPKHTACDSCISNAQCPGGSEIVLNPGFWRNGNQSITVFECFNENACLGQEDSKCQAGYVGVICSRCSGFDGDKIYARTQGSSCEQCAPLLSQIFFIMIAVVARVLYIMWILNNLLNNPKRNKPQTVLIRIVTNYIQVITLVKDFDLVWPKSIQNMLQAYSQIADSQESFFSVDCLLAYMGYLNNSTHYVKVILMGVTPLIFSFLSIPVWLMVKNTCKKRMEKQNSIDENSRHQDKGFELKDKILATTFTIIILWHPAIITYSFSLFLCVPYTDGFSYLKKDMQIKCWDSLHYSFAIGIGFGFIFTWGFLFPLAIYSVIKKRRKQLNDIQFLKTYGIFYIGLNDDSYYWEIIIVTFRKVSLIIVATVISASRSDLKGYAGILILFIQKQLSYYNKPYIDPRFNEIDSTGCLASMCTIFGGLIFLPVGAGTKINHATFSYFVIIGIGLFNFYFWVTWGIRLFDVVRRTHYTKIQKIAKLFGLTLKDIDDYDTELKDYFEKIIKEEDFNLSYAQKGYKAQKTRLLQQEIDQGECSAEAKLIQFAALTRKHSIMRSQFSNYGLSSSDDHPAPDQSSRLQVSTRRNNLSSNRELLDNTKSASLNFQSEDFEESIEQNKQMARMRNKKKAAVMAYRMQMRQQQMDLSQSHSGKIEKLKINFNDPTDMMKRKKKS